MTLDGADHYLGGSVGRDDLARAPHASQFLAALSIVSGTFLDAYLLDRSSAIQWLRSPMHHPETPQVMRLTVLAVLMFCLTATAAAMKPAEVVGPEAIKSLRGKVILLAGATGNNGSVVLRQLGDLGLPVRAMSRDADAAREEFGNRYEWVQADVTDPTSLVRAMAGVDIVISAVATSMPVGGNRPEKVDYEGTINLARAAKAAGVQRFVIITSSHSGETGGWLNLLGRDVLVWKGKAEEVLVASGMEYVIVGPARINDEAGGAKQIGLIPRAKYANDMMITREDLASVVIAVAGLPAAANRSFSVINTDASADAGWSGSLSAMPVR